VRLIEPAANGAYRPATPGGAGSSTFAVARLAHIFGSEELSARAPAVAGLVPAAYVALHPDDAARLGLPAGAMAEVSAGGSEFAAPVVIRPTLARGAVGVPAGLPSLPWFALDAAATVRAGAAR
jgi:NADH-quinone oxidoreductase subunit G